MSSLQDRFFAIFSGLIYLSFFTIFYVKNASSGKAQTPFDSSLLQFPPFNKFPSSSSQNKGGAPVVSEEKKKDLIQRPSRKGELESPTRANGPKTWGAGMKRVTLRKDLDPQALLALKETLRDKLVEQLKEATVKKEEQVLEESAQKRQKSALKTGFDIISDSLSSICSELAKVQHQSNQNGNVSESDKEKILNHLKVFAEVVDTVIVPPVEANTKAVVRKRLPSFKNASEISAYFSSSSSVSSPPSASFLRQKQWREDLEKHSNAVCKSVSLFVESLGTHENTKVLANYSQGMKDITNLMRSTGYSILGHQSISSKDVTQASQTIKSSIDSVKYSDANLNEFVKTVSSVSTIMEKLGNALGNCADLDGVVTASSETLSRVGSSSNNISIQFFVKAMTEFSIKLEEKAGKAALAVADAAARERITDGTREMRGAFVFLQLAISQATNESLLKKMVEKAKNDARKSMEEGIAGGKGSVPYLQLSAACVSVAEATSKLVDLIKSSRDIQDKGFSVRESQEKSSVRKSITLFEERDVPDMEWTTDPTINKPAVKAGTINQLALHFFTTNDERFVNIFLQTLPSFSSSLEMITKWEEFYVGVVDESSKEKLQGNKKTVEEHRDHALDLLLRYVEDQGSVLSSFSRQSLISFLSKENYSSKKIEESRPLQAKRKYIRQMVQKLEDKSATLLPVIFDAKSLLDSMESFDVTRFIFQVPVQDLAVQFTLLDQQIFRSIKNVELLGQCWTKEKTKHIAFRLLSMINRFNNISLWAASTILWQENEGERNEAIVQLITLSEALFKLRSYNSFFAIIASLQFTAINRIVEKAFESEKIPRKKRESYQELLETMNPKGSFKTYRSLLNDAGDNPCIPFMGMYLTDLVFTDEGNLSFLDEEDTQINWNKYTILYDIIARIQRAQRSPFTQSKDEKISSFLIELPHLNKDKLMELSLLIQPRK